MKRIDFIERMALGSLGSSLLAGPGIAQAMPGIPVGLLKKIGIQLFSMPSSLVRGFEGSLEHGVRHFFVEQDLVKDPQIALKESIEYLKTI